MRANETTTTSQQVQQPQAVCCPCKAFYLLCLKKLVPLAATLFGHTYPRPKQSTNLRNTTHTLSSHGSRTVNYFWNTNTLVTPRTCSSKAVLYPHLSPFQSAGERGSPAIWRFGLWQRCVSVDRRRGNMHHVSAGGFTYAVLKQVHLGRLVY